MNQMRPRLRFHFPRIASETNQHYYEQKTHCFAHSALNISVSFRSILMEIVVATEVPKKVVIEVTTGCIASSTL